MKNGKRTSKGFYVDPVSAPDKEIIIGWYNTYVALWNLLEDKFQDGGPSPSDFVDMFRVTVSYGLGTREIYITLRDRKQTFKIHPGRGFSAYLAPGLFGRDSHKKTSIDPAKALWVKHEAHRAFSQGLSGMDDLHAYELECLVGQQ